MSPTPGSSAGMAGRWSSRPTPNTGWRTSPDRKAFEGFFAGADLVIADTMYSLAESITMKADWGHSSNIMAVNLCGAAGAGRLVLFHHEPASSDLDIQRMFEETVRYEELNRRDRPQLGILCAYDGLELTV